MVLTSLPLLLSGSLTQLIRGNSMQERELIAILRGITLSEADAVVAQLIEAGFTKIEIPLNSPEPLKTIAHLQRKFGEQSMFGAGTVLNVDEVKAVADTGAKLIVSPNTNLEVIRTTKTLGLHSYPGVMTPSECFSALEAGADGLKFFPASVVGPGGLAAMLAVLPEGVKTYAVGGASASNFAEWMAAGATGFGLGSALYKPGRSAEDVGRIAQEMVRAYDRAR